MRPADSNDAFEVRWVDLTGGGNLPLLFHKDPYIPVRLPFQYLTLHAQETYAESTQGVITRALKALYQYCYGVVGDIHLDEILAQGEVLNVNAIVGFGRWLRNRRPDSKNVVNKIGLATGNDEVILRSTVADYLHATKQYLLWAAQNYAPSGVVETQISAAFEEARTRLDRIFSRFKRPATGHVTKGLNKSQIFQLRRVARPGSHLNPFKGEAVQYRNWCILESLYVTGMRRGELLSAYSCDKPSIHNGHKWTIRRRPPDPLDPRVPRPAIKTKERDIQLLPKHSDLLRKYVDKYRFVFKTDRNGRNIKLPPPHDFLFISTDDGAPLSLDAVNKMFTSLGEAAFPDDEVNLHPHLIRNTFCNEFMEYAVDVEGKSVEKAQDELRRLCGWSLKSEMPSHYAQRWSQRAADGAQERRLLELEAQDKIQRSNR